MSIFKVNGSCIYALINHQDKKIYITYSRNFTSHLYTNLRKVYTSTHEVDNLSQDREKLDFLILETGTFGDLYMRYKLFPLQMEWIAKGYTVYKLYKPLQWETSIEVDRDPGGELRGSYRAYVCVKTSEHRKYRIASFKMYREAEKYLTGNALVDILRNHRE